MNNSEKRTAKKYQDTFVRAKWFISFHKKPIWIIPTESEYCLSVIEPLPENLPIGTSAIQLSKDKTEIVTIKTVKSS